MRLSIRAEQMTAIELETQEKFVRRMAAHLLEAYPKAIVILPAGEEKQTVDTLPKETLLELVRIAIARARSYDLTFESAIAGFTALMFEIAPNFHTSRICQVVFNDAEIEPNVKIDLLVSMLTEKNVVTMQEHYDPAAWKLDEVPETENPAPGAETANPPEPNNTDYLETVKIT
jgi:hypothetical protein